MCCNSSSEETGNAYLYNEIEMNEIAKRARKYNFKKLEVMKE